MPASYGSYSSQIAPQTEHYNNDTRARESKGGCGRGPTHEITPVREQSSQGAYAEDRSIHVLAVDLPSVYLLLRKGEYTRVYTTVYPRVHYLALSMSPGGLLCTALLGANV